MNLFCRKCKIYWSIPQENPTRIERRCPNCDCHWPVIAYLAIEKLMAAYPEAKEFSSL